MLKHLLLALSVGFGISSCTANKHTVSPDAVSQQVAEHKALLLDVRTPAEFKSGHVSYAVNIPHDIVATQAALLPTDKSQPIYVYCRSGRRSLVAIRSLNDMGYTNTHNLGGVGDMTQMGFKLD